MSPEPPRAGAVFYGPAVPNEVPNVPEVHLGFQTLLVSGYRMI